MKKLSVFVILMLLASNVFAMGWLPGKCHEKSQESAMCALQAYGACAKKLGTVRPIPNTSYSETVIDPNSAEFKACLVAEKASCMKAKGC